MSMGEIIVILIVAILVLGPEKLPSTAVQIAKILKALKRQVDEAKESINRELRISELQQEAQKYKDELSEYNQNIRKKLSFEEFDELKESLVKEKKEIDESLNAVQKDIESLNPASFANLKENEQDLANLKENKQNLSLNENLGETLKDNTLQNKENSQEKLQELATTKNAQISKEKDDV